MKYGFPVLAAALLLGIAPASAKEESKTTASPTPAVKAEVNNEGIKSAPAEKKKNEEIITPKTAATPIPVPATSAGAVSAVAPATAILVRNVEELKTTLLAFKAKEGTIDQRNDEVRKKVRLLLDFDRLGKLSLGQHNKKVTAAQIKDFQNLFRSLIEKSYLSKLDNLVTDYTMKWDKEEAKGGEATVYSTVIREAADVQIKYFMEKTKGQWLVYNIVFDDLNLARNYQTQFNKIIQDKGFNELLRKMRSKLSSGGEQL